MARGDAAPGALRFVPTSILVTGGAGFIGSHVVLRLAKEYPQYRIVVLDKLDYCASVSNLSDALETDRVILVRGDILDRALVREVLREHRVDAVMHFAAQTHVDNSFGNSLAFTLNNTLGTHALLEACREVGGVRRFVNVSTDEVYGDTSHGLADGVQETSTLEPTNPYSAAKAGAEMLVKAYQCSYGLPCVITRGNNVYGPHQFPEKLIPKFAILADRGLPLPVHGTGVATRSYLYVEDVAEAFDIVLHRGEDGQTYNIGTQDERTVVDVARDVLSEVDEWRGREGKAQSSSSVEFVRDRLFNDRRYFICDKKLAELGWRERTPWREGLRKTVQWYLGKGRDGYWDEALVEKTLQPHPEIAPQADCVELPMLGLQK